MILWLMMGSVLNRRSAWLVPNLFGSTFYGPDAYRNYFLNASVPGLALIVAIYAVGGILWGTVWREQRPPLLGLFGAIIGLFTYWLFFGFIWKHLNPLLTLYAPDRQLQVAHVIWGWTLARSPKYAARMAELTQN